MYELLDFLQRLPKPVRTIGAVFIVLPLALVITRAMGLGKYWWAVMGGIIFIAVAVFVFDEFVKRGDKRKGDQFAGELKRDSERGGGASKQEVREALKELSTKWNEAVKQLQGTGLSIYSLPWYLLIGEPQSGKSTTLKNSGLEFPVGNDGLSGTGGTRNCDWWFANEAVILDTAGRFTFQEENAPDASEWSSFLKLIKRFRKYCPINGVLVVIPATSLLEDTPEEQDRKAANIRAKLINLQRVLEIRFPTFVMFTKADRILGFSEFFSKLDPVDQKQLVGWSNQLGPEKSYDLKSFDGAFDDMLTRIHKLRLRFTANEEIVQNVDRIFVFPEELRALREPIKRYFQGIFVETRYDEPFSFRGFYISSGVQQGKPIARATRELLGGSGEGAIENLEQIFKRSRAFFIKDFYEKKVFPEQGLIARTRAAEKREKQVRITVWALSAAIVLMVVLGLIVPYLSLRRYLTPIKEHVQKANECVTGKTPCRIADAYAISRSLYDDQQRISKKSLLFLMFFRGAKSSELAELLTKVNRKLYFDKVAGPVLVDAEARLGALDWEKGVDYRAQFFPAFENHLRWVAIQKPFPGDKPIVKPDELKLGAATVPLILATKGVPYTARSAEVDEWAAQVQSDGTPDLILASVVKDRADAEKLKLPGPDRAVRKFEDYWTVSNLLRWDFKLNLLLGLYAGKYRELIAVADDPTSTSLLARAAGTGKEFKKIYDDTTKHLATPRVASVDFPGLTPDAWERWFRVDYDKILPYKPVMPALVNENRREQIVGQMKADYLTLNSTSTQYAYLVQDDPANKAKKAWTPSAAALSPMLVAISDYADLDAFKANEKPDQVLVDAAAKSSSLDRKKTLEDFNTKQRAERDAAIANAKAIPAIPPDAQGDNAFKATQLQAFVDRTPTLALIYRTIPYTQTYLEKEIGPGCDAFCFNKAHALAMVDFGVTAISDTENAKVNTRTDVQQMGAALGDLMYQYLVRYIDRFSGRPVRTGGGGFYVPVQAVQQAQSWRTFQQVIQRWSPEGGGGGEEAASLPAGDPAGALTQAEVEMMAGKNTRYLGRILDYYRSKQGASRAARAPAAKAPQEVIAAVNQFKNNVLPLSDQELKAWRQLSTHQDQVSLKGYHAFSRNPVVRRSQYRSSLELVERKGANLIRDAIRPSFQQAAEPVVKRLREQCMGQFPFIGEAQLRTERVKYADGSYFKQGGAGNTATYRIDLPTIGQTHFSGPLSDVGALADEYAIDPILWGWEPDFDFVGDANRPLLAVGRGWQVFIFGGAGARGSSVIKEHKIEIRPVTNFTPSPGKRFMGDRVNALFLFDRNVVVRPSTDFKTGRSPNPYVWRLGPPDAPISITGRDEESKDGWTGSLDIYGGPLKFFYFVRIAAEDRERREWGDDPEKERDKDKIWTIRVQIPNAQKRDEPLEGVFELAFDEPMPGILAR